MAKKMTQAEKIVAAFAQGLMRAVLDYDESEPVAPITAPHAGEDPRIARVQVPDIQHPPEEIDLFKRMKDAVAEGDIDMADVAQVEEVLRMQREAREKPRAEDAVKRVQAPDA
jgi:hypothetical protein